MNDILYSSDCGDETEKWHKYQQVLQRYLHFKDKPVVSNTVSDAQDVSDVARNATTAAAARKGSDAITQRIDAHIVETVPSKYKSMAASLLKWLREAGNITWDKTGSVVIEGASMRGANVIDLLNDAMRDRKRRAPVGHRQFANALRRASVPQELVGNKRVWNNVLATSESSSSSASSSQSRTEATPKVASSSSDNGRTEDWVTPILRSKEPLPKKRKLVASSGLELQKWRHLPSSTEKKKKKK